MHTKPETLNPEAAHSTHATGINASQQPRVEGFRAQGFGVQHAREIGVGILRDVHKRVGGHLEAGIHWEDAH